jgi:hypothetical protein
MGARNMMEHRCARILAPQTLASVMTALFLVFISSVMARDCSAALPTQSERSVQTDAVSYLRLHNQLFVGTIVDAATVHYEPIGPCSNGVTPRPVGQVTIHVSDVIHGGGVREFEVVRLNGSYVDSSLKVGTKVLAFGNRTCADNWKIWGEVAPINGKGEIAPRAALRTRALEWSQQTGGPLKLEDVKAGADAHHEQNPSHPFLEVEGIHLVVITGVEHGSPGVTKFQCRPIGIVAGPVAAGPTEIDVHVPKGAPCLRISPGDSLIVPYDRQKRGPVRVLTSCADYLRVDHGMLPGLGTTLAEVMSQFAPTASGFRLMGLTPAHGSEK